jgi:hypothetical protein
MTLGPTCHWLRKEEIKKQRGLVVVAGWLRAVVPLADFVGA